MGELADVCQSSASGRIGGNYCLANAEGGGAGCREETETVSEWTSRDILSVRPLGSGVERDGGGVRGWLFRDARLSRKGADGPPSVGFEVCVMNIARCPIVEMEAIVRSRGDCHYQAIIYTSAPE